MKSTAQFWQQHALAARRSSDSTSAYAKRHGLALSTLYYWQSKLKATAPTAEISRPAAKFVALCVIDTAPKPQPNHCTLVLPAGMRLEMSALPTPEWLVALGRAAQGPR